MKGKLVKTKEGWKVQYLGHPVAVLKGEEKIVNYIPLHADDVVLMPFKGQLLNDEHYMENKQVEFEIIDDVAKLVNSQSMILQEAINILTIHQQWRQGADIQMSSPRVLTEALDVVLDNHLHNQLAEASKMVSNNSWEGCDGCTEQDEAMYKNGYAKGYNVAIAKFSKEITDKKIEKQAVKFAKEESYGALSGDLWKGFVFGAKWMQEQLKHK